MRKLGDVFVGPSFAKDGEKLENVLLYSWQ